MSVVNLVHINSPTVPLALTTTSARIALPQKSPAVMISNTGTTPAWVSSGDVTVVAVASTGNGVCVPGGMTFTLRLQPTDTHVAGVTATGTSTLSISNVTGAVNS